MTHIKTYTIHKAPIPIRAKDQTLDLAKELFRQEDQDREHIFVFATDYLGNIIGYKRVATGQRGIVHVSIREILQAAILLGSEQFWLAHNHPGGGDVLSKQDLSLTLDTWRGAKACGMFLRGHILYSPPNIKAFAYHEIEDLFNKKFIEPDLKPTSGGDVWSYNHEYLKGTIFKLDEDKYSTTLRFTERTKWKALRQIREFKRLYLGMEKG